MDIFEEVNSRYDTLSPVQKRIADYIFNYPDEVSYCSLKSLSESLGVTEVTVLRFTKKIGLSSFVELKKCMREHMQNRLILGSAPKHAPNQIKREAYEDRDRHELFREFVENEEQVLKDSYAQISVEEITEAVSMIRQAQQVYVISSELLMPVSSYMARRLLTLGLRAMDIGCQSRALYNNYASHIGPEDVAILFTFPGYSRQLINTAKYLRKKQVPLVVITDKKTAPAALCATTVITCNNHDLYFYNSPLGAFSVASMLAYFTAIQDPKETDRLRARLTEARGAIDAAEEDKDEK